jgi:catechol 2,3-dioxygenase-like lactoylglutathione lyase family enzyme
MEGKQKERPEIGKFHGFDHITIYVGNALQASSFYVTRLGFTPYAYEVILIYLRKKKIRAKIYLFSLKI